MSRFRRKLRCKAPRISATKSGLSIWPDAHLDDGITIDHMRATTNDDGVPWVLLRSFGGAHESIHLSLEEGQVFEC